MKFLKTGNNTSVSRKIFNFSIGFYMMPALPLDHEDRHNRSKHKTKRPYQLVPTGPKHFAHAFPKFESACASKGPFILWQVSLVVELRVPR